MENAMPEIRLCGVVTLSLANQRLVKGEIERTYIYIYMFSHEPIDYIDDLFFDPSIDWFLTTNGTPTADRSIEITDLWY